MASHEFVIAVKLWLGITVFPDFLKAIRCMCGHTTDLFGDHLLGCVHGSLRSRRHNALRDITRYLLMMLVHALRSVAVALLSIVLGMHVYHPNFTNGKPAYFDVSIWNTMQPSYIIQSSNFAGAAAFAGEEEKNAHRQTDVKAADGCFYPLIVETFVFWTLASLATAP